MQTSAPDTHTDLRDALRALCAQFPPEYHRKFGEDETYPEEFVDALTREGWLAAMIPEEYGGSGLGLTEASIIMEEVNRCGGNAGHCPGQMYNMGTLLRHGSDEQKQTYLPGIASGALRLQSMAVTEPTTGTDTTKLKTTAVKKGDRYEINGQKVWISRIQHSDLMILLARTTPLSEVKKKSQGLSIFMVDLKEAIGNGMEVRPIANMPGHETNEVFFDNLEIPAENLIGTEGRGFYHILDGLNAERTLIAAECIGDGYWFVDKARAYAGERIVFDRPIGQNQGVQFPIAKAYARMRAAEEGLPVLRSTTTGISAVIDARGVVREHIGRNVEGRIDTIVPPPHVATPFARLGHWLTLLWGVALLALSLVAMRRSGVYPTRNT